MQFLFYTHSLVSDWNHGNVHFLRGVMRELVARGHVAIALEPENGWSRANLLADQGPAAADRFKTDFPELKSVTYGADFHHEAWLSASDVVVVHEWTNPELIARIGRARAGGEPFTLFFHDTHHRAVSWDGVSGFPIEDYDAVLAFGEALRELYQRAGWGRRVFTWHEAADDRLFNPRPEIARTADVIWIGNWGDDERSAEIGEFLVGPMRALGFRGTVRGVRYPEPALAALSRAGIDYGGWIANADVPAAFAAHRATVHIPRRPYVERLPGIPTIRMFEALACGIPLVSAPWRDSEELFRAGRDFLFARNGAEMARHLRDLVNDSAMADEFARAGCETIAARHTCRHRVDQLFEMLAACDAALSLNQPAIAEAAE
jgi:spore maturation protein CgeB